MARKNGIITKKLQATVDETTDKVVSNMVALGIYGANKSEVSSWIIRTWILNNIETLKELGIKIVRKENTI